MQRFGQGELVSEPCRDATVSIASGVGDGPVEFPLLEMGPLVAVPVAQKRVLEPAAEGATEVHDRGRAGDGGVEVADGFGVGRILGDPADVAGVVASDLPGGEGCREDVEVVRLVGRIGSGAPAGAVAEA